MDLWSSAAKILGELNTNPPKFDLVPGHLREDIRVALKTFSKIANIRAIKINRISSLIMDSRLERLCFRLSKISIKELAERLQKLWESFRKKNLPRLDVSDETLKIRFSSTDTYILLNTIKNIHHALAVADPHTNLNEAWAAEIPAIFFRIYDKASSRRLTAFRLTLEALEVMAYIHHHTQTMPSPLTNIDFFPFHDFVHCSKCWRLVPKFQSNDRPNNSDKKYQKNLRAFYCDEHSPVECQGHTLTEYHKAIKLPCNNKKEGVNPATAHKTYELMRHFPSIVPDHPEGLSAQDWYEARVSPLHLLDLSKYPKIIFDLNWIWKLCPNVLR